MKISMLTTVDNPYDPFDEWDDWYAYDTMSGHHSSGYLARIAKLSDELSEVDINLEIENAIDSIMQENVSGVFRKVTREVPDTL
jgi:hypothetical protein